MAVCTHGKEGRRAERGVSFLPSPPTAVSLGIFWTVPEDSGSISAASGGRSALRFTKAVSILKALDGCTSLVHLPDALYGVIRRASVFPKWPRYFSAHQIACEGPNLSFIHRGVLRNGRE